jgi:2-amino-4-hydroxy-6-hydroxymethyldihydropteridine diphosphokinase
MRAWIGLGGNMEGSREALVAAVGALADVGAVGLVSSLYQSAPRERADQPDFLNAALAVDTDLAPRALLAVLKAIERRLGRDPLGDRYGPRLVDLDILAIEGLCFEAPELTVPHPRLAERRFALEPIAELDPDLRPWNACADKRRERTVAEALAAVADQDVSLVARSGWEWPDRREGGS